MQVLFDARLYYELVPHMGYNHNMYMHYVPDTCAEHAHGTCMDHNIRKLSAHNTSVYYDHTAYVYYARVMMERASNSDNISPQAASRSHHATIIENTAHRALSYVTVGQSSKRPRDRISEPHVTACEQHVTKHGWPRQSLQHTRNTSIVRQTRQRK